jgi:hypothetical protein
MHGAQLKTHPVNQQLPVLNVSLSRLTREMTSQPGKAGVLKAGVLKAGVLLQRSLVETAAR